MTRKIQNSPYHWLLLKNGQIVIGTRGNDRVSWAWVHTAGHYGCADSSEVVDTKPIPWPKVEQEWDTVMTGGFK